MEIVSIIRGASGLKIQCDDRGVRITTAGGIEVCMQEKPDGNLAISCQDGKPFSVSFNGGAFMPALLAVATEQVPVSDDAALALLQLGIGPQTKD